MKYACLHTHTEFCDGKGDVETFCQRAWEKGFHSLGFSAHAPIEKKTGFPKTGWTMNEELLGEYIETVNSAKRRWQDRLPVFLGLEVDFIDGLISPADKDYREMGLDYIIGSVHYVLPPRGAPFTVDAPPEEVEQGIKDSYGGDPLPMVEAYWDSLEALIRSGGFDILGHPDILKKNNSQDRLFSEDSISYRNRIIRAAALAGEYKVTIEVNTGGMNRGRTDSPYPSLPLLKLFRENNVPALINADAHNPGDLDGYYPEARKHMLEAGYINTVVFLGKKNNDPLWQIEEL
jgi:histidinol-phosphatase (PHP family)